MTPSHPTCNGARRRAPSPHRLIAVVAAVLMASPGVAHPISLSHLLRLPLEELLRLEITASMVTTPPRVGATLARPMPFERSAA